MTTTQEKPETQAERIAAAKAAQENAQRKRRKGYDPGRPGRVVALGEGRYRVESFRQSGVWYDVDLNRDLCTCPDAQFRNPEGGCKHAHRAAYESFKAAREKAREVDTATLNNLLLSKYSESYRPEEAEAIRYELHFRESAA